MDAVMNYHLWMQNTPSDFVKDHLSKDCCHVYIIDAMERIWSDECTVVKAVKDKCRLFLDFGWRAFYTVNHVKPGDRVTFTLENQFEDIDGTYVVFSTVIRRAMI